MRGRVTADRLNIRSYPGSQGKVVGTLLKNSLVNILSQNSAWYEIEHHSHSAYVYASYVEKVTHERNLKGRVKAEVLNVREEPGRSGRIAGVLSAGAIVDITSEEGEWYRITFNNQPGFIHKDYVSLMEGGMQRKGVVNTDVLNVRKQPSADGEILGQLVANSSVEIVADIEGWYEIKFNNGTAFVSAKYITITEGEEEPRYFYQMDRFRIADLAPAITLPAGGTRQQRRAASTWNQYGNLLEEISATVGIDVGCAIAVLCVESGGDGYDLNRRMIIRFENHQFNKFWGKNHPDEFAQHFAYDPDQVWKKHTFRQKASGEWMDFHGNQDKEWQVLDFARGLDDTAALKSISMGAPQVMGFNYRKIGYQTVQDMFENFNKDIRYHIFALFDFLDNNMISALKNHDFELFARYYNGPGQAATYGEWIQDHFDAYQGLSA